MSTTDKQQTRRWTRTRLSIWNLAYNVTDWLVNHIGDLVWLIFGALLLIACGLAEPANQSPVLDLIRAYPVVSVLAGFLLILLSILLLRVWSIGKPKTPPAPASGPAKPNGFGGLYRAAALFGLLGTTLASVALVAATMLLLLVRPSFCPSFVCAPPKVVPLLRAGSVHDSHLEVYLTAIQNNALVLPDAPATYTLSSLAELAVAGKAETGTEAASAVLLASSAQRGTSLPYRVVIGVHSLQQNQALIVIQAVSVEVVGVEVVPDPLNVWITGSLGAYQSNPYRVTYRGQPVHSTLESADVSQPLGHVELDPGEADDLDVQIDSTVVSAIQFKVHITYEIVGEPGLNSLTASGTYSVVFADVSNWHPFVVKSGVLVPAQ